MNPEKEVTVVIPVYNRSQLIERCLASIDAQTRHPARVIVVDNGSTDDTIAAVQRWSESRAHKSYPVDILIEETRGAWAARNKGLENVETEWVSFFDSDDIMCPNYMEKASAVADDADIVYWKMLKITDGKSVVMRFSKRNHVRRHIFNSLLGTQRYMVRADFIRAAGGWQEAKVWDDWELGIRLLGKTPRMRPVPEVLSEAYAQEVSITGTSFTAKQGEWEKVIDKVDRDIDGESRAGELRWKGFSKKRLHGMTDYVRVILAAQYTREDNREAGKALLKSTLEHTRVAAWRKVLLKFIYHYTRLGGRAAYLLWY